MADREPEQEEIAAHPEPASEEEILAYWTEERMKSAQPLPLPSPEGTAPNSEDEEET